MSRIKTSNKKSDQHILKDLPFTLYSKGGGELTLNDKEKEFRVTPKDKMSVTMTFEIPTWTYELFNKNTVAWTNMIDELRDLPETKRYWDHGMSVVPVLIAIFEVVSLVKGLKPVDILGNLTNLYVYEVKKILKKYYKQYMEKKNA